MTAEQLGSAVDKLLSVGARDVFFTPVFMKKNRPGTKLTVLCSSEKKDIIAEAVLKHTSTFGVRFSNKERSILERKFVELDTEFGPIRCKLGMPDGELLKYSPEYEDCKAAAAQYQRPIADVYNEAISKAKEKLTVNSVNL
jgi:uncharacterized protein (DUF111 family)